MLSKRLQAIADLCIDSKVILDVGCDHAWLSIFLANLGKKIIASDIAEKPLAMAQKNIAETSSSVELVHAPGLKAINKEVDTVIIAGMGFKTIKEILDEDYKLLLNVGKLIISSHTEVPKLRRYISSKGFYISDEKIVFDNNKYYIILVLEKGSQTYSLNEINFGPILSLERSDLYIEYLTKELEAKRKALAKAKNLSDELKETILRLENFINS